MFDLTAKLGMKSTEFDQGLKNAEKKAEETANKFTHTFESALGGNFFVNLFKSSLGAVGLGAFATFAKGLAEQLQEEFKEIKLGSQMTGLDPEAFQKIRNVIEYTGASSELLARAMQHVAQQVEKVKEGGPEGDKAARSMIAIGGTLSAIKDENYQKVFYEIAEFLKTASIDAEKLSALKDVFGKGSVQLLPAFKIGFDSALANKGILSDEDMAALEKVKKISIETGGVWKDVAHNAGLLFSKSIAGLKAMSNIPKLIDFFIMHDDERNMHARIAGAQAGGAEEIAAKDKARQEEQFRADQAAANADEQIAQTKAENARKEKIEQMLKDAMDSETKAAFGKLTPIEKRAKLKSDIEELSRGITFEAGQFNKSGSSTARLSELTMRKERADKEDELRQLEIRPKLGRDRSFDSLNAIGGFTGNAAATDLRNISADMRDTLHRVERVLERIKDQPVF